MFAPATPPAGWEATGSDALGSQSGRRPPSFQFNSRSTPLCWNTFGSGRALPVILGPPGLRSRRRRPPAQRRERPARIQKTHDDGGLGPARAARSGGEWGHGAVPAMGPIEKLATLGLITERSSIHEQPAGDWGVRGPRFLKQGQHRDGAPILYQRPVSPMKMRAGAAFHHRNPPQAPIMGRGLRWPRLGPPGSRRCKGV